LRHVQLKPTNKLSRIWRYFIKLHTYEYKIVNYQRFLFRRSGHGLLRANVLFNNFYNNDDQKHKRSALHRGSGLDNDHGQNQSGTGR